MRPTGGAHIARRVRYAYFDATRTEGALQSEGVSDRVTRRRVTIDTAIREVRVGSTPVHLTRLEFDLLALLAARPREVLSRDDLLAAVWHSHRDWQSPATVSEHVRRLRLKFQEPGLPSLLATVRGVGYRFDPAAADVEFVTRHSPRTDLRNCFAILDGTRILDASPGLVHLLALPREEVVGRDALEFVAPSSLAVARRRAALRAGGELPRPERLRISSTPGVEVAVDVATTLLDHDGALRYQVSVWPVVDEPMVLDLRPASRPPRPAAPAGEVAEGLARDEFEPYFEPIVHLENDRVLAVEALARWHHPARGLLTPAAFLPAAEESGEIIALGRHLLRASCAQLAAWRRAGHDLDLAVNLSACQLGDPGLVDDITDALGDAGLAGERLLVEITETDLIEDVDAAGVTLRRLADLGVRVCIDDFGTGWASLTYLLRLPVHVLKIDRSFTAGVTAHGSERAIARSIMSLGRDLDLLVVAEGIETDAQRAVLADLGCWLGQGYRFALPKPAAEVDLTRGWGPA